MIDQCSAGLLPPLGQNPPRHPAPCRNFAQEWNYWKETKQTLKLELETIEADQFLSPLSPEEREQIRRIYEKAMDRCQAKMDNCLI